MKKLSYGLVCGGRLVGVYEDYEAAARDSKRKCRLHGLIVRLPYEEEKRVIGLGLPW